MEHNKEEMSAEEKKVLYEQYENYLCAFCRECAYLEDVKIRMEKGRRVDKVTIESHLCTLRNCKEALLDIKGKLKMTGGIDFTKDASYQGFAYIKGQLKGDPTHLYRIVRPWLAHYDNENTHKYEAGVLLMFHYQLYEKRRNREWKKKRCKAILMRVVRFCSFGLWNHLEKRKKDREDAK